MLIPYRSQIAYPATKLPRKPIDISAEVPRRIIWRAWSREAVAATSP